MYRGKYSNLIKEIKQKSENKLNESFAKDYFGNPIVYYTSSDSEAEQMISTLLVKNPVRGLYDLKNNMYIFGNAYNLIHADLIEKLKLYGKGFTYLPILEKEIYQYLDKYCAMFKIIDENDYKSFSSSDGYKYAYIGKLKNNQYVIFRNNELAPSHYNAPDELKKMQKVPLFKNIQFKKYDIRGIGLNSKDQLPQRTVNESIKQSNLNDNFWKWFQGSKVIDKNGNPLICYHCTNQEFNTFDKNKIGTAHDKGHYGTGFYFSLFKNKYYGKKCLKCYLNIKNPYFVQYMNNDTIEEFSKLNLIPNNLKPIIEKIKLLKNDFQQNAKIDSKDIKTNYGKNKIYTVTYKNNQFTTDETMDNLNTDITEIKHMAWFDFYHDTEYKIKKELLSNINSKQYSNAIKKAGYDGIIVVSSSSNNIENAMELVVFEPNQIKSIDNNGNWDSNSNNIMEAKHRKKLNFPNNSKNQVVDKVINAIRYWDTGEIVNEYILFKELIYSSYYNNLLDEMIANKIKFKNTDEKIYKQAINYILNNMNNSNSVAYKIIDDIYRGSIEYILQNLENELIDNNIYREINTNMSINELIQHLKKYGTGNCWAKHYDKAESYNGGYDGTSYIFVGQATDKNISWYDSILLRTINEDENEIRLRNNAPIRITKIIDKNNNKRYNINQVLSTGDKYSYAVSFNESKQNINEEKIIAYHSGEKGIKSFKLNKTADNMFFFTNSIDLAKSYVGFNNSNLENQRTYTVELNINNPLNLRDKSCLNIFAKAVHPNNKNLEKEWLLKKNKYWNNYIKRKKDIAWFLGQLCIYYREEIKNYALKNGYDAIFNYEPTPDGRFDENWLGYIVFNPKQIHILKSEQLVENKLSEAQEDIKYILSSDAILFSCDPSTYDFMLKCLKQGQKPEYFYFNFYKNRPTFMNLCRSLLYRFTGNKIKGTDDLIKKKINSYDGFSISKEAAKVILNGYYGKLKVGI